MVLKLARRGQIPPFIAMDVLRAANEQAAAGEDVLHLEVGQPSTPAPGGVLAAARAALGRETLGYTDALGLPALREAIAAHYRRAYAVSLDPARIVVTTGSSGAFLLAFLAAFEPGDRVAMAAPAYPAYRNILTALDLVPVELPAGPDQRYQMTLELLLAHRQPLDGLIVASPANPTGTMLAPTELAEIARSCRDMGIRFISDEVYHGIVYAQTAATALASSQEAIVVKRYAANRALLLAELPKAGLAQFAPADGAFYLYADVGHLTNDSPEFCRRMLREIGVACTPGVDFDSARGNATLRISFAGSSETMTEAARRLIAWRR
jgi:aspartate/methionine/tyrosine aminotransferase